MAMAATPLLLALDQGTSSSRAALFDPEGQLVASASAPLEIHYPADGWVEQDPAAIWNSQRKAMADLEARLTPEQRQAVAACGITNQRETTVLWQRSDGAACGPALVWQDGRTADLCQHWKGQGLEPEWKRRTGLLLDPYFSASKIHWLLEHQSAAISAAGRGDLCFGTVESWLLWQLSGRTRHCSDMSNASRTLLMDLEGRNWNRSGGDGPGCCSTPTSAPARSTGFWSISLLPSPQPGAAISASARWRAGCCGS